MIPNGTYKVVCAHLESRQSTSTGRPYLMATHVVIDGPYAGEIIHQALAPADLASWIWSDVVESPADLGGELFMLDVHQETWMKSGRSRMRATKMHPLVHQHKFSPIVEPCSCGLTYEDWLANGGNV